MALKHKSVIALQTLLAGLPVYMDGYTYYLGEDYELCIEAQKYKAGNEADKETVYLKVDYTLEQFINLCEKKLTDEESFRIGANKVLNDIKNGR